jgi:hypothetical protein
LEWSPSFAQNPTTVAIYWFLPCKLALYSQVSDCTMKSFQNRNSLRSHRDDWHSEPRRCGARFVQSVQTLSCVAPKVSHYSLDHDDDGEEDSFVPAVFEVSSEFHQTQGAQNPRDDSHEREHWSRGPGHHSPKCDVALQTQFPITYMNDQLNKFSFISVDSSNSSCSDDSVVCEGSPLCIGARLFRFSAFDVSNDGPPPPVEATPNDEHYCVVDARNAIKTSRTRYSAPKIEVPERSYGVYDARFDAGWESNFVDEPQRPEFMEPLEEPSRMEELLAMTKPFDDRQFTYSPQNEIAEGFVIELPTRGWALQRATLSPTQAEIEIASPFRFQENADSRVGIAGYNRENQQAYSSPEEDSYLWMPDFSIGESHRHDICRGDQPTTTQSQRRGGLFHIFKSAQAQSSMETKAKRYTRQHGTTKTIAPPDEIRQQNSPFLSTQAVSVKHLPLEADKDEVRSGKTCFLVAAVSKTTKLSPLSKKLKNSHLHSHLLKPLPLRPVISTATTKSVTTIATSQSVSTTRSRVSAKTQELIARFERHNLVNATRSRPYAPYYDLFADFTESTSSTCD